ncbi:ABC transporter substrate-binding protein [Vineibacter terrae]|uniref:ABC transporter substrate-binding protein n=1 Tax=Vineibacter terrae TaxID=2586908 RepID=UPI002E31013C|nr:ABC transporter substrate-binding protein [Vineibacter terrae]HEX2889491.1 ABC transporter substrate-binding protein [Vineibacter terrae]
MVTRLSRRAMTLGLASAALPVSLCFAPAAARAAGRTLKVAVHSPLRILDPTITVARITQMHGYMVYDTLFGLDAGGVPKPQMVDAWTVSPDGMAYTFRLRTGLRFHDGAPVTASDAVASLERWGKRDALGQLLLAAGRLSVIDAGSFQLALSQPFGFVLEALAKPGTSAAFVMPARVASGSLDTPIQDATGSGPYIFKRDEWVPGSKAVYVRNPDWAPRSEPSSAMAGAKVPRVERVEWVSLPDANVATSALRAGEIDYYEYPPMDLVPVLEKTPGVNLVRIDPLGARAWIRPNHLYPPFDNPKARQALLHVVDQAQYMRALGVPKGYYRDYCGAIFLCGGAWETDAGSAPFAKPDLEKARQLFKEGGYDGRKVVMYHPTDLPDIDIPTKLTAQRLRKIGVAVELVPMDWGTFLGRAFKRDAPEAGGWNLYHSLDFGFNVGTPSTDVSLAASCERARPGWPCDEAMERLRAAWVAQTDAQKRRELVRQIQERFYEIVPFVPWGQFVRPIAVRSNIVDIGTTLVPVFWNLDKT